MAQYRKLPVVIDAFQWTGEEPNGLWPQWLLRNMAFGAVDISVGDQGVFMRVWNREGLMTASPGTWVIKGVNDELYPCPADVFAKTYEEVGESVMACADDVVRRARP